LEKTAPIAIRIDLPVDAHLPEDYIAYHEQRLEAYRRLAVGTTHPEVDDVAAEWEDRYGPLPPAAEALVELARLRVEAIRVGLAEIVKLRHEIRLAPVDLKPSQEVRLTRLRPRAVLRAKEGVLFIPARPPLVEDLTGFLREMWPGDAR
jgi:transcription-repair coupling factor (superfamily II helicase)